MLNFPLAINIFKNNFGALKILLRLTFNNDLISKNAFDLILDQNHKIQNELLQDKETLLLLERIILEFFDF